MLDQSQLQSMPNALLHTSHKAVSKTFVVIITGKTYMQVDVPDL